MSRAGAQTGNASLSWSLRVENGPLCFQLRAKLPEHETEMHSLFQLGKRLQNSIENGTWAFWRRWLTEDLFILLPSLKLPEMNKKNEKQRTSFNLH